MAKAKDTIFFCKECGYESPKWNGQCPACKEYNTMVEAPAQKPIKAQVRQTSSILQGLDGAKPVTMSEIEATESERIATGIEEFDRVLGGGIIKGSLILIGGDPGIGKSTILTQVCKSLSDSLVDVLYISGEESLSQIKLRADRLGEFNEHMKLLCETNLDTIESVVSETKPQVCIIDSIQTMYRPDISGTPGSAGQVRESTYMLLQMAKGLGVATFVVGHVTKGGEIAGPRMMEHMVDTVLYFEGDPQSQYRILRGVKNRFGSTNEIGVFEMRGDGLNQVKNPSEYLLNDRPKDASGSVVTCSICGTRSVLAEVQALVSKTSCENPRRSASGIDYLRLNLLTAVLEKRVGLKLYEQDVYVNIIGGLRVSETAADLAVVVAIASGYMDFIVPSDVMIIGEVGLSGEIRNVSMADVRIKEAEKMGFSVCIAPAATAKSQTKAGKIRIIGVSNVKQAIYEAKKLNERKEMKQ